MGNLGYGDATASSGGGKTLTQLKTICQYHGWHDFTTEGTAELTNFVNDTLQMLAVLAPWPWYQKRNGSVTFPAKTHTISSIDGDGTTVTIATSSAHGLAAGDIMTVSGTTEYDVAAVALATASGTAATYLSGVNEATETSGTYTRDDNDYETLSDTRIDRIGVLVRTNRSAPLDELAMDDWLLKKQYHAGTGPPVEYSVRKVVSVGNISMEMVVYPEPIVALTMYYTWHAHPLELSDGGDTTDWPTTRLWLLTAALMKRLAAIDRDIAGVTLYTPEFQVLVNKCFAQSRPSNRPIIAKPIVMGHRWRLGCIEKTIVS